MINKTSGMLKFSETIKNKILNYIITIWGQLKEDKSTRQLQTSKYFKLTEQDFPKQYKINQNTLDKLGDLLVVLNFLPNNSKNKTEGHFNSNKLELSINIFLNYSFDLKITSLSSTIEHELMHLTQLVLAKQTNKKIDDNTFVEFYEYAEANNFDLETLSDEDRDALFRRFNAEKNKNMSPGKTGFPKEYSEDKYKKLVKDDFGYVGHD